MNNSSTLSYFVYILTNKNKTVLYTGVTNDLYRRIGEHYENSKPFRHSSFAGRYNAYHLIFYERFTCITTAIAREKEIKGWRRSKKEALINSINPGWNFLNEEV
jgi:putative endonuclease